MPRNVKSYFRDSAGRKILGGGIYLNRPNLSWIELVNKQHSKPQSIAKMASCQSLMEIQHCRRQCKEFFRIKRSVPLLPDFASSRNFHNDAFPVEFLQTLLVYLNPYIKTGTKSMACEFYLLSSFELKNKNYEKQIWKVYIDAQSFCAVGGRVVYCAVCGV